MKYTIRLTLEVRILNLVTAPVFLTLMLLASFLYTINIQDKEGIVLRKIYTEQFYPYLRALAKKSRISVICLAYITTYTRLELSLLLEI